MITNSDHCRDAEHIAKQTGAKIFGPAGEKESFPISCSRWLVDKDEVVTGLVSYQLEGSKTPSELALLLDDSTLITGDLIRCHTAGELCLLPDAKLSDKKLARQSISRFANLSSIESVLTGDGWPIFKYGNQELQKLLEKI